MVTFFLLGWFTCSSIGVDMRWIGLSHWEYDDHIIWTSEICSTKFFCVGFGCGDLCLSIYGPSAWKHDSLSYSCQSHRLSIPDVFTSQRIAPRPSLTSEILICPSRSFVLVHQTSWCGGSLRQDHSSSCKETFGHGQLAPAVDDIREQLPGYEHWEGC